MRRLPGLCAGLVLAFAMTHTAPTALAAADVSGTWTAQMQGPNGDMTLTFHFKQDGEKLTGSVERQGGDPVEITKGKVAGETISFDTSFNGMTINHDGTISGDEIKLRVKSDNGQMPPMDMTLKRSK